MFGFGRAIDADTKLIASYTLGQRGAATAHEFMQDGGGLTDHVWTIEEMVDALKSLPPTVYETVSGF
jgi:hypothetical protein